MPTNCALARPRLQVMVVPLHIMPASHAIHTFWRPEAKVFIVPAIPETTVGNCKKLTIF